MPQESKVFRLFVSSTFSDMREERSILQKEVFPKLEKLCESKGAKFQAVDLRWGVNEESQLDQKTMDICLGEISRCQRISPKPNFIILLGDRYGWQPIPVKIPATEMQKIQKTINDKATKLLSMWYKLDENAIPEEYVLQPRENEYKEYRNWENTETEIRNTLRTALEKVNFSEMQKIKYFASATHQEIINGALSPPKNVADPKDHVFAYTRNIIDLPTDSSAQGFVDLIDGKQDDYCHKQLSELKTELRSTLKDNYHTYEAEWTNIKSDKVNLQAFAEKVYQDISTILSEQSKDIISTDEIEHEISLHEDFKIRLSENFIGRHESVSQISKYLNDQVDNKILSIIGDSGSGKSSLMAQSIKNCEANSKPVYRFIGISSQTSNVLSFLLNICEQIAQEYGSTIEKLAGEGKEKEIYEIHGISDVFNKCLSLASTEKPLTIFIDALDQFSDNEEGNPLSWMPSELPSNVKIIVSALPYLEQQLHDTSKLELPLLPAADAEKILKRWLAVNNRKLTANQSKEILGKFNKNGLPIYLKLAFERSRHWHSYDTNISLKNDVKGIINDFFEFLEKEHTEEFVRNTICYMLSGRYQGLTENEILEILLFDKEYWEIFLSKTHPDHRVELEGVSKLPIVVWSRLHLDLEPFLAERDANGIPIITFFHRQFNEVLRERYGLV